MLGGTLALAAIWMTFAWATLVGAQTAGPQPARVISQQVSNDDDQMSDSLGPGGDRADPGVGGALRPKQVLTAQFEDVPQEHSTAGFSLRLRFSQPIALTGETLRTQALTVTAGIATSVEQVAGRWDLWNVDVVPDGMSSVQIALSGARPCAVSGSVCTHFSIPLSNLARAIVPGPPLSAEFLEAPEYHSGHDRIPIRIGFSEPVFVQARTLEEHGLRVVSGQLDHLRRIEDRHDVWEVVLIPESSEDLVLTLEASAACPAEHPGCLELRRIPVAHSLQMPPATIHLTFDDGPDPFNTPVILDILAQHDARATFFVVGRSVTYFPELIERMVREGHTLANHTWAHDDLLGMSDAAVARTLLRTQAALGDHATPCFRPPNYRFDQNTVRQAAALGLEMVLNTGVTDDWRRPGADVIAANIVASAKPNAILVLHDGGRGRGQTIEGLRAAMKILSSQRYVFEPVCK